jgi:hypothetical protein
MTFFDCETTAEPARAKALLPPFEENSVAVGNIKDEDKIKAKIAQQRATHETNWVDEAALRPETGKILAIGVLPVNNQPLLLHVRQSDEAEIIRKIKYARTP